MIGASFCPSSTCCPALALALALALAGRRGLVATRDAGGRSAPLRAELSGLRDAPSTATTATTSDPAADSTQLGAEVPRESGVELERGAPETSADGGARLESTPSPALESAPSANASKTPPQRRARGGADTCATSAGFATARGSEGGWVGDSSPSAQSAATSSRPQAIQVRGAANAISARAKASRSAKRCSGARESARSTNSSKARGRQGFLSLGGRTVSVAIECRSSYVFWPANGREPVAHSYKITPKEN